MAVDEASRRLLHERAAAAWGAEAAAVLMDHLPPAGWSDLARRSDVEHETALLRSELAGLSAELRGEMAGLSAELRGEISELSAELRGEMTALRLELSGDLSAAIAAQTRWMVTMLALLGALFTTATVLTG